jgi:hypothetical protein
LCSFGTFSGFGIFCHEKSGDPDFETGEMHAKIRFMKLRSLQIRETAQHSHAAFDHQNINM